MSAEIDEPLLDRMLEDIEKARAWSPRLMSKLEAFLRSPDESALVRINPLAFAREKHVTEVEAIDVFLHGARVGLFSMEWHLLCPSCSMQVESFGSLRSLHTHYVCELCKTEHDAQLDDFIQVSFSLSPRVRRLAYHDPDSLSLDDYLFRYRFCRHAFYPDGTQTAKAIAEFMAVRDYVPPHSQREYPLELVAGLLSTAELTTHGGSYTPVEGEPTAEVQRVSLVLTPRMCLVTPATLRPGPAVLEVDNRLDSRAILLAGVIPAELMKGTPPAVQYEPFVRGSTLLTNQTFRQLFRSEVIAGTEGIGIRDVTILFTDLKGSTALYERIGDLKAFARVRQHFDRLATVVAQHRGALIKTIGDAVMAAFLTPDDAVRAALQMLDEIDRFNAEHDSRDVVLKIGMHRGASIAVTMNEGLDYFGTTVNIAARVQGLADADQIVVTDDVHASPGVADLLTGFAVSAEDARLRGIQKEVRVHRAVRQAH